MKNVQILFSLLLSALVLIATNTVAQKLPNIQSASVHAPVDIKIDGNASEWNNQFLAFNHAAEVFYIVSNNAANIYLTVQSKDNVIIQKIVAGGITFSLKNTDKKSVVAPVTITYPIMPPQYSQGVGYTLRTNDTLSAKDLAVLNGKISDHVKVIQITGVTEIPDSSVSV